MSGAADGGRLFEPKLVAVLEAREGGRVALGAPGVGLWRGAPARGTLVRQGQPIGELEVLSVLHRIEAPAGAEGIVVEGPERGVARRPVAWGDTLLVLDPEAAGEAVRDAPARPDAAHGTGDGLVFRSPMSGRFYVRPGPGKDAFIAVDDEVEAGRTLCLLEVMKTFNRIVYEPDGGLPERARVVRIVPEDGADLDAGDAIVELAPVGG